MTQIAGFGRDQLLLLPEAVDDFVEADNPVRFIDAFVDGLGLAGAGFARVEAKATGRPGNAPGEHSQPLAKSAELNQAEAAALLGVKRADIPALDAGLTWEAGEAGLVGRRLGRASGKRVPADRAEEVERLYRERHPGFTVNLSTSISSRTTALAGATPGSSCICSGRASRRRRRARGRIGASASGGRCRA